MCTIMTLHCSLYEVMYWHMLYASGVDAIENGLASFLFLTMTSKKSATRKQPLTRFKVLRCLSSKSPIYKLLLGTPVSVPKPYPIAIYCAPIMFTQLFKGLALQLVPQISTSRC